MTRVDLLARMMFAEALVREAGQLALDMRANPLGVETKGPRDFATAADKAVEKLIVARLTERFGDAVLGEEFGGEITGGTLWIVDPIDGTYNYAHGNPRWCVSLGFLVDGVPTLGLIFAPEARQLYLARTGGGATLNNRPLSVSRPAMGSAPLVEIGASSRRSIDDYLGTVRRLMEAGIETRRCGSGALGVAQVATGETDGYVEHHINAWDVAAGLVVAREAGAVANDFFAGDGIRTGNPILVATPWLADRLSSLALPDVPWRPATG